MHRYFERLRQRKLIQWLIAYLAAGWVGIQAADLLGDQFDWPIQLVRSITIIIAIGAVATIVVAWFHGERGRQKVGPGEIAILITLVVLAIAAIAALPREPGPNNVMSYSPSDLPGIAVLPPDNLSADTAATAAFAQGLHDDLITQLAKIRDLRVIGRTSVLLAVQRTQSTPRAIGEELDARYVMELTVRVEGDSLRVNARLVDASTDQALWSDHYDKRFADVFAIQSDVAQRIAASLGAELTQRERARIDKRPTENLAAYRLLLEGRLFWNRFTEPDLYQALERFQQALQLDPGLAQAHVGIGQVYEALGIGHGRIAARDAFSRARRAAEAALELQTDIAGAHTILGVYNNWYAYDWQASEANFRQAIRLEPGWAHSWQMYAQLLNGLGRSDEAIRMIETALALDPVSPIIRGDAGVTFWVAGRHAEALKHARSVFEIAPDFAPVHWVIGEILLEMRQQDTALYHLERAAALAPPFLLHFAIACARVGHAERARALLPRLLEAETRKPLALSGLYAWLGYPDSAFAYLEKELDAHSAFAAWGLTHWYVWDPIRDDPRFKALLKQLKLPIYPIRARPAYQTHASASRAAQPKQCDSATLL